MESRGCTLTSCIKKIMRCKSLVFVAVLLAASVCRAQGTDQFASRIEIAAGKLVVLSSSQADSVVWRLVNPPADDNHQVFDGRLIFATGVAGEYWFVESAATVDDGKVTQKVLLHLVKVGTPAPAPGPGPTPAPGPKPLPEGRFGLAEVTRAAVLKTPGIDRKLCAALASDFGVVASQIAAGTVTTFADANAKVKARTQETRKGVEAAWKPVTDAIGVKLNELLTTKKLVPADMPGVQTAFEEIRDGFLAGTQ